MLDERVQREKELYNEQGLKRKWFKKMHAYAGAYWDDYWIEYEAEVIKKANGGKVLEVGTETWYTHVDQPGLTPEELYCINISEAEMERGIELAKSSRLKPKFCIMDAHNTDFEDNTFDVVFGNGILHHLELEKSLIEIKRILKPDGQIVFAEPLDINPVLKLIRWLTPKARTIDEKAFKFKDIKIINRHFNLSYDYTQFLAVPLGLISSMFTRSHKNVLTKVAYYLDKALLIIPGIGYMYRVTMFKGTPK